MQKLIDPIFQKMRVLKKVFGRFYLKRTDLSQFCFDIDCLSLTQPEMHSQYHFSELTLSDIQSNDIFIQKARRERYKGHLEHGHRCFGFKTRDNIVVSYLWLTVAGRYENSLSSFKGIEWVLSPNEAYIWDCRTDEGYRNQGLYVKGLIYLLYYCKNLSAKYVLINCKSDNVASQKGILSAGFTYKGNVTTVNVMAFTIIYCTDRYPKLFVNKKQFNTFDVFPWEMKKL